MKTGTINQKDVAYGAALVIIGGIFMGATFDEQYTSLGIGDDHGPMFFPRILLGIWLLLATSVLVHGFFGGTPGGSGRGQIVRAVIVIATVGLTAYLITVIGFLFASAFCLFSVSYLLGYRNPISLMVTTIIFPIAVWWIFANVLLITLPTSPWFDLI
ncbi:MAG: tripartite tricarboxylate transporter TctB family protein [Rhodospirillales bacterium]|nr:tripartite tricarboxylate transporter TctB family protein [Rhodospirillales bacterium]